MRRRIFAMILLMMAAFPAGAHANPFGECREKNPAWYGCNTDAECEVIVSPCGWPNEASRKDAADPAQRCNIEVGAALTCTAYDAARDGAFHAECVKGRCVAVIDTLSHGKPAQP